MRKGSLGGRDYPNERAGMPKGARGNNNVGMRLGEKIEGGRAKPRRWNV